MEPANSFDIQIMSICLAFVALLTFADTITVSAVDAALGDALNLKRGQWHLGTTASIITTIANVCGQLILASFINRKKRRNALLLNTISTLLPPVWTLITLPYPDMWPFQAFVIAPSLRPFGGGSHTSTFLAIIILLDQTSGSTRVGSIYLIGAVLALCQNIGTSLVAPLAKLFQALPYVISIASCLLAVIGITFYVRLETDKRDIIDDLGTTVGNGGFREGGETTRTTPKEQDSLNFSLLIWTFALAAIPKVTRTLFTTYVTRRYGVPSDEAQKLWLMRTIMTIIIFSLLLPSTVVVLSRKGYSQPSITALMAGKSSILLVCIGALMVGLARTIPALTVAVIVNTLRVAVDLSLLAFAASIIPRNVSGRIFLLIASAESFGTLIGIFTLYPVYQWGLTQQSWAGGTVYYVCAALYAICVVLVWRVKPSRDSSTGTIRLPCEIGGSDSYE